MEHYFNEGLLYAFIYRYYPFNNLTEDLIKIGESFFEIILKKLIESDQSLWGLKDQPIKEVNNLVSSQFSYRIGGIQFFYGAFGNFYFSNLYSHQNSVTFPQNNLILQKIQQKVKGDLLDLQQIKDIKHPLKDRLNEIAYYQKNTNCLPLLNQKQIQMKKLNFIRNFMDFEETQYKKNKKKYRKKDKNSNSKYKYDILSKQDNFSYLCGKIQEQIKTEVDEFQHHILPEEQNFVPQKIQLQQHPKKNQKNLNIHIFQNKNMNEKFKNMEFISENQLILKYDDLLPKKIRHKSKRVTN